MEEKEEILKYWFGRIEETMLPTPNRTRIWFSDDQDIDDEIRLKFAKNIENAILGNYLEWEDSARGVLTLIILYDQFSRKIYRGTPLAFAQDHKALDLCLRGIERQFDHSISLIERAFFYFPLMRSENAEMQATAIRAYKILVDLSFMEVRSIFEQFLELALNRFDVIKRFGRFPQRNEVLNRISTEEEMKYLQEEYNSSRDKS